LGGAMRATFGEGVATDFADLHASRQNVSNPSTSDGHRPSVTMRSPCTDRTPAQCACTTAACSSRHWKTPLVRARDAPVSPWVPRPHRLAHHRRRWVAWAGGLEAWCGVFRRPAGPGVLERDAVPRQLGAAWRRWGITSIVVTAMGRRTMQTRRKRGKPPAPQVGWPG
jgi:hypothetical protein